MAKWRPLGVFLEHNICQEMRYSAGDQHTEETAEITEAQRQRQRTKYSSMRNPRYSILLCEFFVNFAKFKSDFAWVRCLLRRNATALQLFNEREGGGGCGGGVDDNLQVIWSGQVPEMCSACFLFMKN
jgi:hypothetical protein